MPGETNLTVLLKTMNPILRDGEYVFCSIPHHNNDFLKLDPIGMFYEDEGLTIILRRECADQAELTYSSIFRMVTLSIHSSLEAVGFLAAITTKLAQHSISVNSISAYYHDHLFIPTSKASEVMELLKEFSS